MIYTAPHISSTFSYLLTIQICFTKKKNLKSLETTVNKELEKVHEWLTANKLNLNIKKSNFVIFHPYQKKVIHKLNINVLDHN